MTFSNNAFNTPIELTSAEYNSNDVLFKYGVISKDGTKIAVLIITMESDQFIHFGLQMWSVPSFLSTPVETSLTFNIRQPFIPQFIYQYLMPIGMQFNSDNSAVYILFMQWNVQSTSNLYYDSPIIMKVDVVNKTTNYFKNLSNTLNLFIAETILEPDTYFPFIPSSYYLQIISDPGFKGQGVIVSLIYSQICFYIEEFNDLYLKQNLLMPSSVIGVVQNGFVALLNSSNTCCSTIYNLTLNTLDQINYTFYINKFIWDDTSNLWVYYSSLAPQNTTNVILSFAGNVNKLIVMNTNQTISTYG